METVSFSSIAESVLVKISHLVWGEYLLIPLLAIVAVYLSVGLKFMPWLQLRSSFRLLAKSREKTGGQNGDISPFNALMTALSATIGTGNIAGVATAIHFGGPGAVFWMWVIALFGMATKYAEAVLAVHYREINSAGRYIGGPMYYIQKGLGPEWHWLAILFAFFGMIAAFGIGNTVQSNSVADVMHSSFAIDKWLTGLFIATLTGIVIIGGIKRIATFAGMVVPVMAFVFISFSIFIIVSNITALPEAIRLILESAFETESGAGVSIWLAMRWGFARGIFSNEAGLGSAAIAHAAARTNNPTKQGKIAMLGTFIDTICICSLTAFVIIITGTWDGAEQGASLSALAFTTGIGPFGGPLISVCLAVFAFTTIIGWSYYGERCAEYLFGSRIISIYRTLWIIAILIGAVIKLEIIWAIADIFNGLMALPNLIALLLLSPIVFKLSKAS